MGNLKDIASYSSALPGVVADQKGYGQRFIEGLEGYYFDGLG